MELTQSEQDNLTRWKPADANYYETYYVIWKDLPRDLVGWVRYTLYASTTRGREAAVWGTLIDRADPSRSVSIRQAFPLEAAVINRARPGLVLGNSGISHREAWGEIGAGGQRVSWNLRAVEDGDSVRALPAVAYSGSLVPTKYLAPHCWYPVTGEMRVDGRVVQVERAPATQAHFWGPKQVGSYVWGNCNTFDEDPDFAFEGVAARMPSGLLNARPMTCLVFRWEGQLYACNGLLGAFLNESRNELCAWDFRARHGDLLFEGEMRSQPDRMVFHRFVDPDGQPRYTHVDFGADLTVHVSRRKRGAWQRIATRRALRSSNYEVAIPSLDPRVTFECPQFGASAALPALQSAAR